MPDFAIPDTERRQQRVRRYLFAASMVGVTVLVAGLLLSMLSGHTGIASDDLLIATVKTGTLDIKVEAPGVLQPRLRRWVTAASPGVVEAVKVQPGDQVESDSVLAVITNPKLRATLVSAKADVATAKANLVSLRAQLQNQLLELQSSLLSIKADAQAAALKAQAEKDLAADNVVSSLEYQRSLLDAERLAEQRKLMQQRIRLFRDNVGAQLDAQKSKVSALEADLEVKQSAVDSLQVHAQLAGVIQSVPIQSGQTLDLGDNIARIASLRTLHAVLQVPPSDAGEITIGLPAHISLNLAGGTEIKGSVSRVAPAVANGSVEVDIDLTDSMPDGARPNLSVFGVIEIAHLDNTIFVQRPAYSQPGANMTLYKLVDNGAAAVPVKVRFGRASDGEIEIKSNLSVGDKVVISDTQSWEDDRVSLR